MASEVGTYVLPVIASFEGIDAQVNKTLGSKLGLSGKKIGKDFGTGMASGVKEAEAAVKKSTDAIVKLRDKQADAAGKVRVAEEKLNEVRANKKSTSTQIARAEEAFEKALRGQAQSATATAGELRKLSKAQKDVADATKNMSFKTIGGDGGFLSGITSQMNGVAGKFNSLGSGAGKGFVVGAAAAILAGGLLEVGKSAAGLVVDGFKSILDTGLDFSKTVNNFQGVTRATDAEMTKFQQTARALGSDTTLAGASASDAALAMTELAKAGFTVDDAMTGARGTLELATAGQIDAAKAAEIQANAMNAFGLKAGDAAHVADLLANAAIASSADIPDLGLALQQVGGIAHGFGVSLDDTVAALAMFANAGVKGSDAGTLLKTTMQSITDQGNPAQGAIDQLGLSLYKLNAAGDKQFVGFKGPDGLFAQLDEAKKRMTSEEFQAETNILFGSDAMRSAMLGNQQAFDQMLSNLGRVGAASDMAKAQMQGLPGAVESFKNTAESIKLDVFESLGPAVTTGLTEFTNFLTTHKSEIASFFSTIADAGFSMGKVVISAFVGMASAGAAVARAFGADGVAKDLQFAQQAGEEAFKALDHGQEILRKVTDRAGEAAKLTDALGKSVSTLKVVGDDVTIDIKDNTPEVQQKLATLSLHLEEMANDPTKLRIVSDTAEAEGPVNAFRQQQQGTPIDIPFSVHYEQGQSFLPDWFKYIGGAAGPAPLPVSVIGGPPAGVTNPAGQTGLPTLGGQPFPGRRAAGGLFGAMPSSAVIQPATPGLIQWAEPSTGGEAFIPLSGGQRSRNIWAQTGHLLGVFEQGGFMGAGIDALLRQAASMVGTKYSRESGDDCSGSISQLVNAALGLPPKADRMSTATAADWLAGKGAVGGYGPPGTFRIGWKNGGPGGGHMAATLPDGTNVEQGGSTNGFTMGAGASGADDPQFTNHAYLPIEALYPDGTASGSSSPYGSSGGAGGSYTPPSAKEVREADQKVADADERVKRAEQKQKELKADAKQSEKDAAQADVDKAKREAADARADAEEVKKGKFKPGTSGSSKGGLSGSLTDMAGQALTMGLNGMLETVGADGSWLPDIQNLGITKTLEAALGIKVHTPQGTFSAMGFDPNDATTGGSTSMSPFGMQTTMPQLGAPASGVGAGPAPGPVDQSTNINIHNPQGDPAEIEKRTRTALLQTPRLDSHMPAGF